MSLESRFPAKYNPEYEFRHENNSQTTRHFSLLTCPSLYIRYYTAVHLINRAYVIYITFSRFVDSAGLQGIAPLYVLLGV